jgi:tetratricopeptide (TPR) repeat protein
MPLAAGARLGPYEILAPLGAGGMGEVYRARDARLGREVAVKVLPAELATDADRRARFEQEARAASALNHPNIVVVHDVGFEAMTPYLAMELVEGRTLREILTSGPLPVRKVLDTAVQIADGLAKAHAAGIVHRDLKPDNLIVSSDGFVKILDFGLAKVAPVFPEAAESQLPTLERHETGPGTVMGTVGYMSPEQASGRSVDFRSDQFSLGSVLYEMATGERAFKRETAAETLSAIIREEPAPIARVNPTAPPPFAWVVERCLAKDPEERYASTRDLARELRSVREHLSDSRPAHAAGPRPWRWRRGTIGVGLALAAFGIGIWVVQSRRGERAEPAAMVKPVTPLKRVAVGAFENRTGDVGLDPVGRMLVDGVTQGLGQIGLVEVVPAAGSPDAVVSGTYYFQGEKLQLVAQVTDPHGRGVLTTAGPVEGSRANPKTTIDTLVQQVTGHVACFADPSFASAAHAIHLPSFEAYRELAQGRKMFGRSDWEGAIPHLERAAALDPSFVAARVEVAWAHHNLGRYPECAALCRKLDTLRGGMTPFENAQLDALEAELRGDWAAAYRATRQWLELAPHLWASRWQNSYHALMINRPREAVAGFLAIDPQDPGSRDWIWYWFFLSRARHLLGDHGRELEDARRARREHPNELAMLVLEVRALAALERVADVEALLRESTSLPSSRGYTPADVMASAADELRAHGHGEAAQPAIERAVAWYRNRPAAEAATKAHRSGLGNALYTAGRWDEARAVFEGLQKEFPDEVDHLGYLGAIAARQGRREDAQRIAGQLLDIDRPYLFGANTYWRAGIAALLGEKDTALDLVREAIAQGSDCIFYLHRDMDFEGLRSDPRFRELLTPQG